MLNTARALAGALSLSVSSLVSASQVWINEIHYDNAGRDVGEFIELAGPAGTDLKDWSLVLYNGNNGSSYGIIDLDGRIPDVDGSGYGFLSIAAGLQNGHDALALVAASNGVHQFIGYEGTFTAMDGPAAGLASEDIGVFETSDTPIGHALALVGSGSTYHDFEWAGPVQATPGTLNGGQSLSAVPLPGALPLFGSALVGLIGLARRKRSGSALSRCESGSDESSSQHCMRLTNLRATLSSSA